MKSLRLVAIAAQVASLDVVADIGSDHGYIPRYLCENGHKYVYASENKQGPYSRLKNELNSITSSEVVVDLADGIAKLPSKVNTLIIAGMGGDLIADILTKYPNRLKSVTKVILAPNGAEAILRQTLVQLGFKVTHEEVLIENAKFYEIIVANRGNETINKTEAKFGKINLEVKSEPFIAKWNQTYERNAHIMRAYTLDDGRLEEIKAEQTLISRVIREGDRK